MCIFLVFISPPFSPQGNHRKSLAVKHHDGEPLTRVDLQYDLLYYLFNDSRAVFTDPYVTLRGEPAGSRVTFRDLYVNALVHSPRCSKVSRDKLLETPAFANEFAKISLLSNVGRINTTMACECTLLIFCPNATAIYVFLSVVADNFDDHVYPSAYEWTTYPPASSRR